MTLQPTQNGNKRQLAEADLIDRIANALPEELRGDYYREMSHCRALPENDEMLRILRAMQFLTVLIERAPGRWPAEREQLATTFSPAPSSLWNPCTKSGLAYQQQLEARYMRNCRRRSRRGSAPKRSPQSSMNAFGSSFRKAVCQVSRKRWAFRLRDCGKRAKSFPPRWMNFASEIWRGVRRERRTPAR